MIYRVICLTHKIVKVYNNSNETPINKIKKWPERKMIRSAGFSDLAEIRQLILYELARIDYSWFVKLEIILELFLPIVLLRALFFDSQYLIYLNNDRIKGCILVKKLKEGAQLGHLFVTEKNKGIGTALLMAAEAELLSARITTINLYALEQNIGFYKKNGYVTTYKHSIYGYEMEKELA